jgi:hypothetical protein
LNPQRVDGPWQVEVRGIAGKTRSHDGSPHAQKDSPHRHRPQRAGRSVIASDAPSPHVLSPPDDPPFGMTDLWVTDTSSADNSGSAHCPPRAATAQNGHFVSERRYARGSDASRQMGLFPPLPFEREERFHLTADLPAAD